jgi:hypothetical protein
MLSMVPDILVQENTDFAHLTEPAPGRLRAKKAPEFKMSEELQMEMQFAGVAEILRRVCFGYGNRFIEADNAGSDDDDEQATVEYRDKEAKVLIYQLPNTDVGPYDPARISPSVLIAFAEDMMITPDLLLHDEASQAVIETLDRRRRRAHLPASLDKTLYDFLLVCANKIMAKRPYCNVFGSVSTRQKVRALVDFVSLDCEEIVSGVLDSRFSVRSP